MRQKVSGPGDRAIQTVGLRPLDCWDRGFESRWRHGCWYLMFVVGCVVSDLCDNLIPRSGVSYLVCVSNCVWSRHLNTEVANLELDARATGGGGEGGRRREDKNEEEKKKKKIRQSFGKLDRHYLRRQWDTSTWLQHSTNATPLFPHLLSLTILSLSQENTWTRYCVSRTPSNSAFHSDIIENRFILFFCSCSFHIYL